MWKINDIFQIKMCFCAKPIARSYRASLKNKLVITWLIYYTTNEPMQKTLISANLTAENINNHFQNEFGKNTSQLLRNVLFHIPPPKKTQQNNNNQILQQRCRLRIHWRQFGCFKCVQKGCREICWSITKYPGNIFVNVLRGSLLVFV